MPSNEGTVFRVLGGSEILTLFRCYIHLEKDAYQLMKRTFLLLIFTVLTLPALAQSIELSLAEHHAEFPSNKGGDVSGRIYNKTNDPLKIVFRRWQTLPQDWTSTVCLDVCYADFVDSLPWGTIEYSTIEANSFVPFIIHFYPSANSNDSASAYVKISVVGSGEEDTLGVWVTGKSNAVGAVKTNDFALNNTIANYPNPAVSTTTFKYSLTERSLVTLSVYDVMGREVASIVTNEMQDKGTYESDLDVSKLATGSYIYKMNVGGKMLSGTLNVVK